MNKSFNYGLEFTVFISGAVVMIYEITGARIVAPYLGSSITVWTALIGVVLAALSAGNYYGGRLSDKDHGTSTYGFLLLLTGGIIAFSGLVKDPLLFFISAEVSNLEVASVLSALFLFGPASFFLGFITPYATRLKILEAEKTGISIGKIYSISTAGSIFGTFIAGFILIPLIGSSTIIYLIAIAQVLISLIFLKDKKIALAVLIIVTALTIRGFSQKAQLNLILDKDTKYSRIQVYRSIEPKTKRPINLLTDGPSGAQSAAFLDSDELVFDYLKFFRNTSLVVESPKNSLMIGGGAFSYPVDFINKNPNATMDVIEINPDLEKIAKEYFRLKSDPRIKIINEDGRTFLNNNKKSYDLIFIDAFKSDISPPFQLTTSEATEKLRKSLSPGGAVMINLIGSLEGKGSGYIKSQYKTYKETFSEVFLFPINNGDVKEFQNIILLAFLEDSKKSEELLNLIKNSHSIEGGITLTDDYAPVESLMRY